MQGLDISLRIAPESALVSQIKRRLADACFGQAKYDRAQKYADEGLSVAEKIGERVEIAACWRVYAQLENHRGHQSTARGWFAKAIDIFSMIGSQYELAATRYLAAVSGVYQNGERQALLNLARAYFESEEVAPYLAKIDLALKKLPTPSVRTADQAPTIIAENAAMRKLIDLARHVAQSDMTILLTGPTGTGKDLLSEYIHYHSGRTGKYVPVNTAAIPDGMIESELFGHRKGAFTGAEHRKLGLVDEAAGGTLYLNEIADSSPEFQAKLLDVLERRRVRSLGSTIEHKVDFRLIAASNQDLAELVRQNKFRADLYHRLNQVNLALPPLDDRKEDIPALVKHFLFLCGITPDEPAGNGDISSLTRFIASLASHSWVGNVRALKAKVERLAFTCKGDLVRMAEVAESTPDSTECDAERDRLIKLLETTGWNRREVARRMGIAEGTVRYKIAKYGLNPMVQS
ncbi:MAG: sigma 54-interacting transcriptional regulator [candidate division Zixibacteria bacterium]|nr:sigma 54-interacting transcriptional regulator [candidate division Zixibacteria bacterium]